MHRGATLYGPIRPVEAISRLAALPEFANCVKKDSFLRQSKDKIDQNKYLVMASESQFIESLDGLMKEFTAELKRRNRMA